jgi:predicted transcriptional regulator
VYNVYTRSSKGVVVAESVPLTARVAPTIAARLKALAAIEDRSVSYLVAEALERYLADEEWQLAEIQAAVAEADAPSAYVIAQEDLETWAEQIGSNPDVPPPAGRPRGNRASAA